jgi:small conductance mechanosensitive channel
MNTAFAADTTGDGIGETTSQLANLLSAIVTKIPLWIAGFLVIFISFIIAKIARRIVENKMAEKGIEEEHRELQILGGRMTHTVILTLGITVGLKIAGIDLTTIIAAVAFGIGFALKDLIMNFLAGVMILVGRHFSIGDYISIGGTVGKVVEIQSRVTILQAINGTKVIVPNSEMFKKQIVSFTSNPYRRIGVTIWVDYANNLQNAVKLCMKVISETKGILIEPKPSVLVDSFGDSGVTLKIRAWVNSKGGWLKIKSNLTQNLKNEFEKYGVNIPWTTSKVVISNEKDEPINETMVEEKKPVQQPVIQMPQPQQQVQPFQANVPLTPALQPQTIPVNETLKPSGEQ